MPRNDAANDQSLGSNVRRAREAAGVSVTTLAGAANISAEDIELLEAGRPRPNVFGVRRLTAIARAVNTTPSALAAEIE